MYVLQSQLMISYLNSITYSALVVQEKTRKYALKTCHFFGQMAVDCFSLGMDNRHLNKSCQKMGNFFKQVQFFFIT